MMKTLISSDFFIKLDAVKAAKFLLGKLVATYINDEYVSGIITETEAYLGIIDKASLAYGGRKNNKNMVLYERGGCVFVYICYGMHYMFNIVCNRENLPEGVLIRSLYPYEGLEVIAKRRKRQESLEKILRGPGKVSQGLGLNKSHNGQLLGIQVYLYDIGLKIKNNQIIKLPRVGIDYAEEWKDKLLNFQISHDLVKKKLRCLNC